MIRAVFLVLFVLFILFCFVLFNFFVFCCCFVCFLFVSVTAKKTHRYVSRRFFCVCNAPFQKYITCDCLPSSTRSLFVNFNLILSHRHRGQYLVWNWNWINLIVGMLSLSTHLYCSNILVCQSLLNCLCICVSCFLLFTTYAEGRTLNIVANVYYNTYLYGCIGIEYDRYIKYDRMHCDIYQGIPSF